MASIQIRNVSEKTLAKLRERAKRDKRSVQQEAHWLLEQALTEGLSSPLHLSNWQTVDTVRERLASDYGTQPDSTADIRKMREER